MRIHRKRGTLAAWLSVPVLGMSALLPPLLAATVTVTTTAQRVAAGAPGDCSLQEAIYAVNFQTNKAIDPQNVNGPSLVTGCVPAGIGAIFFIDLQPNAVYLISDDVADPFNFMGAAATPMIIQPVSINGNGARLERTGGSMRAFVVGTLPPGTVSPFVNGDVYSGNGQLSISNLHIKGFIAHGGDGSGGGGGGMGAGGAIYTTEPLVVANSTFEGNTARGGNGAPASGLGPGGGGGGSSASAAGGNASIGGAGGGGGARGNGGNGSQNAGGGGGGTLDPGANAFNSDGGNGGLRCGSKGGLYPVTPVSGPGSACTGGGGGGGAASTNGSASSGGAGGYGGAGGGGGSSTGNITNPSIGGNGGPGGFGGGGGGGGRGLDGRGSGGSGGFGAGGGGAGASGANGVAGTAGTFGGNGNDSSGGGGAGLGGAIFSDGGSVDVSNTTFFGNAAIAGQGAGSAEDGADFGGAIFTLNSPVTIRNVTIAGGSGTADLFVLAQGGSTTLTLRNSILASNSPVNCVFSDLGGGVSSATGENNLVPINGGCPAITQTLDPQLGALQRNPPGNTPTMRILPSSPAYDAGGANCMATDQRGVPRPQFGACDIGAYEHAQFTLDVDYSSTATKYDPLIDGLLILRWMFGFRGAALTDSALGATAQRVDPDVIASYLTDMGLLLDADGNNVVEPLTDGLLILRFLEGLKGDGLVGGAIGENPSRPGWNNVQDFLDLLVP